MELESPIQGSHPLSRYGDRALPRSYPRYCPRRLHAPVGFHRFEPVDGSGSLPPRAMLLTRQGISLSFPPPVSWRAGLYLGILDSSARRFVESSRRPLLSDARPSPSAEARLETSRSRCASLSGADAPRRMERCARSAAFAPSLDRPFGRRDSYEPRRIRSMP